MQDIFFTSALSPLRICAEIEYLIPAAHAQFKKKKKKTNSEGIEKWRNLVCKPAKSLSSTNKSLWLKKKKPTQDKFKRIVQTSLVCRLSHADNMMWAENTILLQWISFFFFFPSVF